MKKINYIIASVLLIFAGLLIIVLSFYYSLGQFSLPVIFIGNIIIIFGFNKLRNFFIKKNK